MTESSRACTFDTWTSTAGSAVHATASRMAIDVWLYAPRLSTAPTLVPAQAGGGLVDPVHELALVVRLTEVQVQFCTPRGLFADLAEVVEGAGA